MRRNKRPETSFEQAETFYNYLQDDLKLSPNKAFKVIYQLQEGLRIFPDHYEQCNVCKNLYDSWNQGEWNEEKGKWYCDGCNPRWK